MTKRDPTIYDVAGHVGVSAATVSRALNPGPNSRIKSDTIRRIVDAAAELGYQPNRLARSLKSQMSRTIGLLVADMMNPVYMPTIHGVQGPLEDAGYIPIIMNIGNDPQRKRAAIDALFERQIDGLLDAASTDPDPLIERIAKRNFPIVTINRVIESLSVSAVANDNARGITLAVDHLFKLGHRRIAHVSAPLSLYTGRVRYRAFLDRLEQLNITHDERLVATTSDFNIEEGHRACKELLNQSRDFSAIVAANDSIALGCLDALAEAGLECPKDISLTGHDNMLMVDRVAPALSTVAVPLIEMGQRAAQMIVDIIENPNQPPRTTFLKPEFIVRDSTGPISRP